MNPVLDAGINLIVFLQSLGIWLVSPMKFFSSLGYEEFYMVFMPLIYWCIDAAVGLRIGVILMLSNNLNGILKMVFHAPRPYFYDARVKALSSETSFGIPSGHAQNGIAFWGLLAAQIRKPGAWVAGLGIAFLIGISRVYLGVHFPTDILMGWVVGAILVWGFLKLEKPVAERLKRQRLQDSILTVWIISILMIIFAVLIKLSLGAWTLPSEWVANIHTAVPDGDLPDPLLIIGQFTVAGTFFGMTAGALLLEKQGGFLAGGSIGKRILRFLLGMIGVLLLYLGLGAIFPRGETIIPLVLRYLRYTMIGLWVAWIAPLVFMRLGLADAKKSLPYYQKQSQLPAE